MPSGIFTLKQQELALGQGAWTNQPPISVNYLVVAGGGGSGKYVSGGGGAGGLLQGSLPITPGTSYTVTVGAGGAGSSTVIGTNGSNSVFGSITSTGGGGGGRGQTTTYSGNTGASGGSGGGGGTDGGAGGGAGQGTSGQGNAGGTGILAAPVYGAGGGGGAGTVGLNGAANFGGRGGAGISSDISGIRTTYAGGGSGGEYGAGGGASVTGGAGGGGQSNPSADGGAGGGNTGGGGGGTGANTYTGGAGGSGIVIISYPGTTQWFTGGTLSYANGNVIHTFYSSGTLAPTAASNYVNTDYQIERSLRFNSADSAYLNRTPAGAGNRTTWTFSGWAKLGALSTSRVLFSAITGSNETTLYFDSANRIDFYDYASSAYTGRLQTTQVFRDPSAWYHIVAVWNSGSATSGDRMRLYINGSEVTAFGIDTNPAQNTNSVWNQAIEHRLGGYSLSSIPWDGYMTEVNFIDGQALNPYSFGYFNPNTGVWSPLKYVGTYGTNGFYLNFSDNSNTTSTTLGKDYSGNGNNWTPNGFVVSPTTSAGNDSLVDSPTAYGTDTGAGGEVRGNYCTANPLDIYPKSGTWTVSNGNLDLSLSGAVWDAIRGTTGVTSGKWYWEITATGIDNTNSYAMVGIQKGAGGNWQDPFAYVYYSLNGQKYNNGSGAAYGNSWTTNDVIGVAFDADAGEIKFYKNNTVQNSGTAAFTGLTSGPYTPVIMLNGTGSAATVTCNFGQRPFAYTAPSGFKALCTQNLPTPTIGATSATQAGKYFNTVLYTGTGSSLGVTGVGFQPDLVWLKSRSNAQNNKLTDAVRGTTKALISNTTGDETTDTNGLTAFNTNGFTVGTDATYNTNAYTYVAWNWNGGGSNATNTSGTITSTVSANTTAGFSIVAYNSGASGDKTVGHGLGVAPSMIITKSRSSASYNWAIYHASVATTVKKYLTFTTDALQDNGSNIWGSAFPTSSVFGITSGNGVVASTDCIAYCFAPVAGYSAFGSYEGNGTSDGPMVYTGFKPAYVLVKRSSTTGVWTVWDAKRNEYNALTSILYPNLSSAQDTSSTVAIDFVSNGFKLRATDGTLQNGTYIYAAFAETPFKYSLAR